MVESMIETQTPEKIHHEISEKLAKGVSYIEALVDYAKDRNLEIETVAEIIKKSSVIKEKIRSEATKLKLVKRDRDARQLCD
jgi:tRNA U34 5-carboxymethylaminomethyl modifying GTPase MnmE/TrmE